MEDTSKTPLVFELATPEELRIVADLIIAEKPCVVLLQGELGAGKTSLVKAVCQVLGVQDEVTSPTFTLINEYRDPDNRPLYHIDLYRLTTLEEAVQIGIEDYLLSGHWCFIEWPDLILPILQPGSFIRLIFDVLPDGKRRICILK